MDEDTGNNSELEHADTQYGGQEVGALVAKRYTVSTVRDH